MPTDAVVGPEVVLDVELRAGAFVLVLANTGTSTAFEPRVTFAGRVLGLGGSLDVSALPIWTGLALLRPGCSVDVLLDAQDAVRRGKARRVRATITYLDGAGGRHERAVTHDLATYDGLPAPLPAVR